MRIDKVHIKTRFKNLQDFQIDIDAGERETVLLGLNATGKSNFLEALVLIFRDLDFENAPKFDYYLKYECKGHQIEIDAVNGTYNFKINDSPLKSRTLFFRNKGQYLPKHIFVYYSGINNRMKELFNPHLKKYYDSITKEGATYSEFKEIPRLFLVDNIHGSMALIAFYLFKHREADTLKFLQEELGIKDFGSALFVLKKPRWAKESLQSDMFWGAKGLVRRFLEDLFRFSLAPIHHEETVYVDYKKNEKQERWYLYIKDKNTFNDLKSLKYADKIDFFNALNSLEISDLIHDLHVNVVKEEDNIEIPNKELSEGEKQLLTVLGMLRFTRDDDALILLDEPDTHLNPIWKWKYLEYIDRVVQKPKSTQIIFCSHDPLIIGAMEKNQVQIFKRDNQKARTYITKPLKDPKGLGVSGILTSDLFGLPSVLDIPTQEKLNKKRFLQGKIMRDEYSELEKAEYLKLKKELDNLGFYEESEDYWFKQYIKEMSEIESFQKVEYTDDELTVLKQQSKKVAAKIVEAKKKGK
ncbi:AAA family ATPase [Flagellimonas sp.]|uniref:AAA family ATPase n=1 Tax=Flagellimonas sp. TaxID=2058762 RepID=UPI003BB1C61A